MSKSPSMPALWCLCHSRGGQVHMGLTEMEVRAFIMALSSNERHWWWAWQEGTSEWVNLLSQPQLMQPMSRSLLSTPPPLPGAHPPQIKGLILSHQLAEESAPVSGISMREIPDLEVETGGEFMPRAYKRHQKRLRVELECNGRKFVSYSLDISVGGVLLQDAIPEWIFGYCTCDLVNEETKEIAELTCSVVENQDPNKRFRLEFTGLDSAELGDLLEQWITAA